MEAIRVATAKITELSDSQYFLPTCELMGFLRVFFLSSGSRMSIRKNIKNTCKNLYLYFLEDVKIMRYVQSVINLINLINCFLCIKHTHTQSICYIYIYTTYISLICNII